MNDAPYSKTTEELQAPTGYEGIYANWNVDTNRRPAGVNTPDDPWDFGTASRYPRLRVTRSTYDDQQPPVRMRLRKNSGDTSLLHRGTIVFSGDPIRAQFWTNYREDTLASSEFSQTAGPEVIVSSKTDNAWEFYAPDTASVTTLEFTLSATDYAGETSSVSWDLEMHPARPTAVATVSENVTAGDLVTLSGAASYAGFKYFHSADEANLPSQVRPIKSYQWTQTSGADVTLNCDRTGPEIEAAGCENGIATFTAPQVDADTSMSFELTVTDERDLTGTLRVSLPVSWTAQTGQSRENVIFPPTACAGDDLTGAPGGTVTLQGACSANPQGEWHQLTHSWSQTSGPTVTLSDAAVVNPSFTVPTDADDGAELEFELTVTGQGGGSDSDTVVVTVQEASNTPPVVAELSPVRVFSAGTVELAGQATGAEDAADALSYLWEQTDGTPTVTLTAANTSVLSFTAPDVTGETALTFRLSVTDSGGLTAQEEATVTILPTPAACAGPDLTGELGAEITLEGICSTNPYGEWWQMQHQWTQLSGPSVTLTHPPASANHAADKFGDPRFTLPTDAAVGATLEFELTVTDEEGGTDTDTVTVTVSGANN